MKFFILVLTVTLHMMIKSLKIILHWCLWHVIDDDFSWHTYLDRWSISHTSPEDKFYLFEEGAFYHLNQQRVPKRAAKFEKGVLSEVRYLGLNMWPGEGWDGGISYNGECLVVWNKRNCDEMGKWILFSRQNQKEHSLINIWA